MKKIIIIHSAIGSIGSISPDILSKISENHDGALICHSGNLQEFDNETQLKILKALDDAKKAESAAREFIVSSLPTYDMPTFFSAKKGKHNPKRTSKYLWRK